ncbi:hypothetical protein TNIN_140171 [Trichonephila inaurata madagascariensis]|uniref:Uncharacterized protein n=1 Tax=Trichonephila inaurata madagascariensis TaxID=2747483 RepID=A0A8X7BN89_9ARAC|nr:hypothetical protein TNIN_140171 [Trichonephila inaurata madagascariensis]
MAKEKWYLDILKLSMIPGIAALIQSKSGNILSFRLCVLVCACTGFVWQTKVMVEEYLSYPTVLHIEHNQIPTLGLPAITFCYLNGLSHMKHCREMGCKHLTIKEFKERYPGEDVPGDRNFFLLPVNLSGIYLLPPEKLRSLVPTGLPPIVLPYFSTIQLHSVFLP